MAEALRDQPMVIVRLEGGQGAEGRPVRRDLSGRRSPSVGRLEEEAARSTGVRDRRGGWIEGRKDGWLDGKCDIADTTQRQQHLVLQRGPLLFSHWMAAGPAKCSSSDCE